MFIFSSGIFIMNKEVSFLRSHEENVKLLYGILSKGYDLMDVLLFPESRSNPRKGLASKLPDAPLEILDVCCGTGCSSIAMAGKNPGYSVTGIDITENMLKVARRKAKKANLSQLSFREMNAAKMDFPDKIFDIVTISLALHEMPESLMESILSEIGRVLKPDGRFYIIEWERPGGGIQKQLFGLIPVLFEPKGFKAFLKTNWEDLLKQYGLKYESSEHYTFTRLITAVSLE
jgi:ubiquinone/menaquinone biosynthesis C-methylase UbiE